MMKLLSFNYTEALFLALAISLPLSGALSTIFWMLLFMITLFQFIKNPDFWIFKQKVHYPLYLFIFLTFLSIIFAINPLESVKELKKVGQIFIMFIFIYHMKDNIGLSKKFVKYFFIGLAISGCFGLLQYFLGINNFYAYIYIPEYLFFLKNISPNIIDFLSLNDGRIQGTQSMHITYAELMVSGFSFLLPLYYYKYCEEKFSFKVIFLCLIFLSIIFTYTRGVWLSLFAFLLFLLVNIRNKQFYLYFLGVLFFIFFFVFLPNTLIKNTNKPVALYNISESASIKKTEASLSTQKIVRSKRSILSRVTSLSFSSNSDRIKMWQTGLNIIKENIFFGVGPKCMIFVYDFYTVKGAKPNQGHLHNSYIQIAVDRGVPASLVFALMLFGYWLFFLIHYLRGKDPYVKALALGGAGFIIVFVVFNVTEYAFADNEVAMMFWSILGCVFAGIYSKIEKVAQS
ncbi:MAG: O-antigen ligase family protein [bacterium]|nr:O-antigen ligase family protein [bacterium]